jgi:hypothetical protein
MRDNRLIDPEAPTGSFHSSEGLGQCPGDNDTCHFNDAVAHDFLDIVVKIRHRIQSVSPYGFLCFDSARRQASRRVHDHIWSEEIVERSEIPRITSRKPSRHDGLT